MFWCDGRSLWHWRTPTRSLIAVGPNADGIEVRIGATAYEPLRGDQFPLCGGCSSPLMSRIDVGQKLSGLLIASPSIWHMASRASFSTSCQRPNLSDQSRFGTALTRAAASTAFWRTTKQRPNRSTPRFTYLCTPCFSLNQMTAPSLCSSRQKDLFRSPPMLR